MEDLTKETQKNEDALYNRYFQATILMMSGKREEAIAELQALADAGIRIAQEKLEELGENASNTDINTPDDIPDQNADVETGDQTGHEASEQANNEQLPVNMIEDSVFTATAANALRRMLSKGQSQKLKEAENSIKISQIKNHPIFYVVADGYYEHRDIYTTREPSPYFSTGNTFVKSPADYRLWEIPECVKPANLFEEQHNEIRLQDSLYAETCQTCGSDGTVPCTNCSNGIEKCPDCKGYGNLTCGYCGGTGEEECSSCYGRGYHIEQEIIGNDEYNSPIYGDVKKGCFTCGGSGKVTCGNCGGSGSVRCGCCSGEGWITCRVCGGTARVTCPSCQGAGYFLNAVNVKQDFGIISYYDTMIDYTINRTLYGNKSFEDLKPNEKDNRLFTQVDTKHIDETEPIAALDNLTYDISGLMGHIDKKCNEEVNTKILNYRSQVYQRDVLDISYEFDKKQYHAMLDTTTEQTLVDVNPYEHVADSMITEIETDVNARRYRSFLSAYAEYEAITGSDDVSHSIRDLAELLNRVEKHLMKVSGIVSSGVFLFDRLFKWLMRGGHVYFRLSGIVFMVLSIGLPIFLTKKFWTKAASDHPKRTEIIIGILSGLLVAIIAGIRFSILRT